MQQRSKFSAFLCKKRVGGKAFSTFHLFTFSPFRKGVEGSVFAASGVCTCCARESARVGSGRLQMQARLPAFQTRLWASKPAFPPLCPCMPEPPRW